MIFSQKDKLKNSKNFEETENPFLNREIKEKVLRNTETLTSYVSF